MIGAIDVVGFDGSLAGLRGERASFCGDRRGLRGDFVAIEALAAGNRTRPPPRRRDSGRNIPLRQISNFELLSRVHCDTI